MSPAALPTVAVVAVWFFWSGGQRDIAVEVGVLALVVYIVQVFWFPIVKCSRCGGEGVLHNPVGKGYKVCGKCNRQREYVRWGRRMWDRRTQ